MGCRLIHSDDKEVGGRGEKRRKYDTYRDLEFLKADIDFFLNM